MMAGSDHGCVELIPMKEFLYPTEAGSDQGKRGQGWFANMLSYWQESKCAHLCFPFQTFYPRTLPQSGDFWMYIYYRQGQTDIEYLRGKVEFRIHVVQWRDSKFAASDIHLQEFPGEERVWFLCDKAEQISQPNGDLLDLHDFEHVAGKKLPSTIRNSVAPVHCLAKNLQTVKSCPSGVRAQ